jgi:hypothetical protein
MCSAPGEAPGASGSVSQRLPAAPAFCVTSFLSVVDFDSPFTGL